MTNMLSLVKESWRELTDRTVIEENPLENKLNMENKSLYKLNKTKNNITVAYEGVFEGPTSIKYWM